MRETFIDTLVDAAQKDETIFLICADLGYSVVEKFMTRFPDRFLNVGVAEQNMMGIATGLAFSGFKVFTYSIVNFTTMRCLEQIRNDVCYHNLPVTIVAAGTGLSYGALGYSHHGIEDVSVMRVMPHMRIFAPCDKIETIYVTKKALSLSGPSYIRLSKSGKENLRTQVLDEVCDQVHWLKKGADLIVLGHGTILTRILQAAHELTDENIDVGIISLPELSPISKSFVREIALLNKPIMTIEEHSLGGLGSIFAETLAEENLPIRFKPIYLKDIGYPKGGTHNELLDIMGLSLEEIKRQMRSEYRK